ncbi:hypothetical protein QYE76_043138 [Lolium multiflorum]|uniref:CCHC-type domain-containing protein n=1 Tax=Lolium multiflorum TaxID=4521 RepID=A0AAD8WVK7_LOLMU|nr:hypothetical protein QYE76_043138 [Lolium multiflorum]
MSITLGAATKLLDDMMINYSEWHTERAPQGKKVNSVEETSSLSDKIDVIMSMLVNGRSNVDPNNVPLASLVAQEENVDVNFIKNNNFNNNAYRNNSGNNYRPYPSANGNGYGNSYGNSYNNNRSVPSGLEAMLKEFISTQTAFNKSVEEKLDKIDTIASRVDRLASDVNLLKLKVMPNNDIDNKITTTANAIQVRINENIRLMAELRARWDREENEKLAKENNVAKVWTITTTSNANSSHVAAPPTINGNIIGVGNVSTPSAKRTKLPEIAKTAETADKTAEIFSNLGNNDPIAVAHNDLDFDDCHISEVIKFLQKLAKSPNASAINLAFTKHITNALIKAREEKLKLETSIPRKLEDGWEPIIKMKFNDFECNALCDLGASISVMPKKIYDMLDLPPLKNCYLDVNLTDNVKKKPLGRIDNVHITVNNNLVPVDFVVLDIECNASCPIVLGRPFLRTIGAVIDMREDMASPINFNQFLEKEKLKSNGSNFTDWFRHVRIFLNGGNLQYVLDAPLGDPPAETETDEVKNVYATRKTRYSQVQCAILCSLEADLQKRFEHHDPHELINELKTIFETHAAVECYEASKHFFSCMMEGGSSVSEHMLAMTGHAKKLSDLGIVIPNRLGINRVLQSLPPSYKNFVMNYNMQNMNKELPELFAMLKSAEIEIKKEHQVLMVNKTTSFKKQGKSKGKNRKSGKKAAAPPVKPKAGPKPDAECYYCKEKGHWKHNCSKYLADLKSGLVKKKKEVPEDVPVPPTPATEEANDNDHETSNEIATEPRRSTRERATPDWYDPCLNVMIVDNNDEDPATYEEAMMSPDSNKWQEAMKSEMGSMYDNKVWTLVDLPDSRKAVENKWIFKRKTDADGMEHWTAVKNILKYLKRTKDMFLCYGGDQELVVTSYTDESWNTDPDDSKSQSGYVFILNGAAVSWASSKQCTVAKSSTESEYIAASEASSEAVWMKRFIVELGVVPSAFDPLVIYKSTWVPSPMHKNQEAGTHKARFVMDSGEASKRPLVEDAVDLVEASKKPKVEDAVDVAYASRIRKFEDIAKSINPSTELQRITMDMLGIDVGPVDTIGEATFSISRFFSSTFVVSHALSKFLGHTKFIAMENYHQGSVLVKFQDPSDLQKVTGHIFNYDFFGPFHVSQVYYVEAQPTDYAEVLDAFASKSNF